MSKQLEILLGQCMKIVSNNMTAHKCDMTKPETQDILLAATETLFNKCKERKILDKTEE